MTGKSEKIPKWLHGFLLEADLPHVEDSIRHAESKTSAEIVPMIVRRSSMIGGLPLTITLGLSLILMILVWPFRDWVSAHHGSLIIPGLMVFFALISFPLSKLHRVQRPLIPNADEERQVHQRAWAEFAAQKVASKHDRRGILLFVSMMERKVVILLDEGLTSLIPPEQVDGWVQDFAGRLKTERWGLALTQTIRQIGEALEKPLPRQAGDTDELGNSLQIKE